MLRVDYARWNQNQETLRKEAMIAQHPRTRERLMALYEISEGKSATRVGKQTRRNPQTIMSWVHRYNQEGLEAGFVQKNGRKNPCLLRLYAEETVDSQAVRFFSKAVKQDLAHQIQEALNTAASAPYAKRYPCLTNKRN